ncbi:MAG: hypothetical protein ABIO67_01345 [Mycobacteriales bacterium]
MTEVWEMSRGMNRLGRLLGASALACASVPVFGITPAAAAVTSETATVGAYYWSANPGTIQAPSPIGAQKPFPDQAKGTDGVAEDELPVAVTKVGAPDKWSALRWDLNDLLPGSVVTKAVIVVPLSTNTSSTRSPNAAPDTVVACAVGNEGFADADAEPFIDAPKALCDQFSAKAKPVDGAYEFDVTALAQKWVDSNDGLALYPSAAGLAEPFQQVFAPKSMARLTIAFTPPAPEVVTPELPPAPVDTVVGGTGSAGIDNGSFTPTAPLPDIGSVVVPPVTLPRPQAQTAPQVGNQPQSVTPVAAVGPPMRFDTATWLAVLGGAVLLLLASLTLGSRTPAPVQSAARRGGVGEQLARRQRATAVRRPSIV